MPMGTQTDSLLCHSCDSKTKCMQMLFQYAKAWGGGGGILRLWEISACFFLTARLLGTLISKVVNVLPVEGTLDQDN